VLGVFSRAYAVNPANGQNIPIWISNYVFLMAQVPSRIHNIDLKSKGLKYQNKKR
jgi:leucyl-tRNA synthetase